MKLHFFIEHYQWLCLHPPEMQKFSIEENVAKVAQGVTRLLLEIITHIKCRANPDEALIAATFLPTPGCEIISSDLVFFVLIGKNGIRDQLKRVKK